MIFSKFFKGVWNFPKDIVFMDCVFITLGLKDNFYQMVVSFPNLSDNIRRVLLQ